MLVCVCVCVLQGGVNGLIVCNTTVKRFENMRSLARNEKGGLSGKPLKDLSTSVISDMFLLTKGMLSICGDGG